MNFIYINILIIIASFGLAMFSNYLKNKNKNEYQKNNVGFTIRPIK